MFLLVGIADDRNLHTTQTTLCYRYPLMIHTFLLLLDAALICHAFRSPSYAHHRKILSNRDVASPSSTLAPPSSKISPLRLSYNNDEDDDDEDDPGIDVDVANFRPPTAALGWNSGRSSPAGRKAMGRSSSSTARVHVCSNCGSEFVKYFGRCPTCKEWNTLQEHTIARAVGSGPPQPLFRRDSGSWVEGSSSFAQPMRLVDIVKEQESSGANRSLPRRLVLQKDPEMNAVLGGGIMRGSLTLIGGDPGVGKVGMVALQMY